jgi:hypothetical protein
LSTWRRYHLDETVTALAIPDNRRFFVRLREPPGESRNPIEFYRWTLQEAQAGADRLVQAYYPHDCDEQGCGAWWKSDG